jgi:hypothetical protein
MRMGMMQAKADRISKRQALTIITAASEPACQRETYSAVVHSWPLDSR